MIKKIIKKVLDTGKLLCYYFFMVVYVNCRYYISNKVSDVTPSDIKQISNRYFPDTYNAMLYV